MSFNRPSNPIDGLSTWIHRGGIPVTTTILIANVATAVVGFFSQPALAFFFQYVWCDSREVLHHPWTIVTYPFASDVYLQGGFIWWVLNAVFFWLSCGSLERSWGAEKFATFFAGISCVGAISFAAGCHLIHASGVGAVLGGFALPMLAMIVAFCSINSETQVMFIVVPLKAKYVSILAVAMIFYNYGPVLGCFANVTLLAAYLYVRYGRSWSMEAAYTRRSNNIIDLREIKRRKSGPYYLDGSTRRGPFDLVGRWKDMQERRKLERLLRNSGVFDPDDRREDRRL
ncbi:MAG: hypothetical protein ACLQVD_01585 [Capsulimonadaceae bacterium]